MIVKMIFIGSIGATVSVSPACNAFRAVLKIVNNLGALAKSQVCRSSKLSVMSQSSRYRTALYRLIGSSGKLDAGDGTKSSIGKGVFNIAVLQSNLGITVFCNHIKAYRLGIGSGDVRHNKGKRIRDNNLHGCFANDFSFVYHLCSDRTGLAIGNKDAICNRTKGSVLQLPGHIFGNFSRTTCGVSTGCNEVYSRTGGNKLVLNFNGSMVKLTIGHCLGNHGNTSQSNSFRAIRETALNAKFTRAFALGDKGGRSATVAVDGIHTAEVKHHLRHFVVGETSGVRSHTAIHHHQHESTVRLDTNDGSRSSSIAAGMVFLGIHINAILYQIAEANGLGHPLVAGQRLHGIAQLRFAILVNNKITAAGMSFARATIRTSISVIGKHLAFVNKKAVGMAEIPAQTYVHRTDNIFAKSFFNVCRLLRHFHTTPVCLVGIVNICRNILKRRHDRDIVVVGVNLNNVDNLSTVARIIIENNFRFNRAGSKVIIGFLNEIVEVAATRVQIQLNFSSQDRHWQN